MRSACNLAEHAVDAGLHAGIAACAVAAVVGWTWAVTGWRY